MIYGYARVSTKSQEDNTSLEVQDRTIREEAKLSKYDKYRVDGKVIVFSEVVSGTEDPLKRERFRKLFDRLEEGDVLIVAKLDRLSRDLLHTKLLLEDLKGKKVKFIALDLPELDTVTSPGLADVFLSVVSVFAGYEKDKIRERMQKGRQEAKRRAEERGEDSPFGRPRTDPKKVAEAIKYVTEQKMSYSLAAKAAGISRSVLVREYSKVRKAKEAQDKIS